jgi:hypothetical protein
MVKLIYDFKQGRATVSNTEHAETSTSIYHSADTTTNYCAFTALCTETRVECVQSITAKTASCGSVGSSLKCVKQGASKEHALTRSVC